MGWASATDQMASVVAGQAGPDELRDAGIARCETLGPRVGFLASTTYERASGGVPMLLKDAGQEIAGTPHWAGLAALRDVGHVSTHTTALAARFERSGFSIIGKSACPPLANGVTTEPPGFAPTRNPWDPTSSAGGSSGGAAAAVACGAVPVAHGSDATGSLRFPAALCGLVTLVPTAGTVEGAPPCGQLPNAAWRDFVVARDARDLTLVLDLLAPLHRPEAPMPGRRVGVLDHDPELGLRVDDACRDAVHTVAALLQRPTPPGLPSCAGSRSGSGEQSRSTTSPLTSSTPPTVTPLAPRGDGAEARATIDTAIGPLARWWSDHDLLVTPATFRSGWPLGGNPGLAECGTLAAPFSLTGQPSIVVPVFDAASRSPVGVQVVGRRGSDRSLLRLAEGLQPHLDWLSSVPPVFAP